MLFNPGDRYVIINADDFGISDSANQAIMEMFHAGAITSASIMMPGERAQAAAAFCRRHPSVRVGIHLTLSGSILDKPSSSSI